MKAMVLYEWVKTWGNNLKLEDREVPVPNSDEVLIRVKACGVGSTLNNFLLGDMQSDKRLLPRVPGHEVSGVLEEIGSSVTNFKKGDRVLIYFYLTCNSCNFCLSGRQDLCSNFKGMIGQQIDGGYAEYMKVPSSNVFKLPESVDFIGGSIICDAIATPIHVASDRAQITPGKRVLVFGAGGGVGIHMVQVSKIYGADVVGIDLGGEKLAAVTDAGADLALDPTKEGWMDKVNAFAHDAGVDAVIDFVGNTETVSSGIKLLTKRGRFVQMTTHSGRFTNVENRLLVRNELMFTGSRYCTKSEFISAIKAVESKKLKPVISVVKQLEEVETIHSELSKGSVAGRAAITFA